MTNKAIVTKLEKPTYDYMVYFSNERYPDGYYKVRALNKEDAIEHCLKSIPSSVKREDIHSVKEGYQVCYIDKLPEDKFSRADARSWYYEIYSDNESTVHSDFYKMFEGRNYEIQSIERIVNHYTM